MAGDFGLTEVDLPEKDESLLRIFSYEVRLVKLGRPLHLHMTNSLGPIVFGEHFLYLLLILFPMDFYH